MKTKYLLSALTFPLFLFSGLAEENPKIEGIVLVTDPSEIASLDSEWRGIDLRHIEAPGGNEELAECLSPYLMADLNEENIQKIKEQLIAFYRKNKKPFVSVQVPEQEVSKGVVAFVMTEGKIETIRFSGNTHFSDKTLSRYLSVHSGDVVNKEQVLTDVSWLNRNPFHRTQVVFSPGQEKGGVDLDFVTEDRRRVRIFGGADNTGNNFTGNTRYFGGFNVANLFFADLFTLQLTSGKDYNQFNAYTANYTVFLPWKHTLNLWGGYSQMRPFVRGLRNEGKDAQASIRYIIPFKPIYSEFTHEVDVGFDYKSQNSSLFFTSTPSLLPIVLADPTPVVPLIVNTVTLSQLMIAYRLEYDLPKLRMTVQLENYCSPLHWLPDQSNSNYNQLRFGARNVYFYQKAAFGGIYHFPRRFQVSWLIRGQISTTPLLPSEQFGLGGFDTVRGYDEREILADDAICTNLELRLPNFSIFSRLKDNFYMLGFLDYGFAYNIDALPTETNPTYLISAGPGLRYTIMPYLIFRADLGYQLHRTQFSTHTAKFNLGGTLCF
jgi:hemolysin activation/secretion protein